MYEKSLNEAQRVLAADKDVIVPVKKLWRQVSTQGKSQGFEVATLPDFTAMLEADPRFEFLPAHSTIEDDLAEPPEWDGAEGDDQMEQMGFYSGDRVKLRGVELTPEIVGGIIRSKLDRTMDALTKAWEKRPKDDAETEETLRVILDKAQELQRDVNEAFSEDRMKQLSKALRTRGKGKAASSKTPRARPKPGAKVGKGGKTASRSTSTPSGSSSRRKPASPSPRRGKRR